MTYEIGGYGGMIADRVRTDAYANALRGAIGPETIVLDIGTGPGILALLACRAGAKHVYAIEPDPVILLARDLARANGFEDRITFIQDISTNVKLPTRVDVIVSDLHGLLPYHDQHIPSIIDARRRFLREGGTLIPQREQVWATLVEAPDLHDNLSEPWRSGAYGLSLEAGVKHALNVVAGTRFEREKAMSAHALLATLDFYDIASPNLEARISFEADRAGVAHGLAVWFDAQLAEGIRFSNDPWGTPMVYGNAFLPFLEPIQLGPAQRVAVRLRADLYGHAYVWTWGAEKETASGNELAGYAQSTLLQSLPPIASLLGGNR
jgi:protein arginine N-methyltransferase 1